MPTLADEVQLARAAVRRVVVGRVELDDGVVVAVVGGRLVPDDALVGRVSSGRRSAGSSASTA